MAGRLNDRRIAALPVPTLEQRQRDYRDETLRAFVVRYRVNRRLRRLTLGPYPGLSLADARRKAREVLGDVARGDDPAQDKQECRDAETFRGLATSYLEVAEKRHRSWKEEKRIIDKDLLPEFGFRLLVDIRRRDVRELVEAIARKRKAPVMANRTLGALSRMFNFALDREWIEASPAARIPEAGDERSRERVLGDDELRELWVGLESRDRPGVSGAAPDRAAARRSPIDALVGRGLGKPLVADSSDRGKERSGSSSADQQRGRGDLDGAT